VYGGTSAPTPSLAGLMTLAVEKAGTRLGCANPALYALAVKQASGGATVFHDVTSGNNSVPGQTGFNAGAGYDLATGLGSVDATLLVNHWGDVTTPTPSFQLGASTASLSFTRGLSGSITLNVAVSGGYNSAVAFSAGTLPSGLTASFTPASLAAPGSGASTLKISSTGTITPGTYNLTISATGGGLTQTAPLAVTIQPKCSYALNPQSASAASAGGSFSFTVTAQNGCSWTAATPTSWITLASGSSGNGNGKVNYTVAANSTTSTRAGSITIAGATLGISQAAGTSSYSLNPTSASVTAAGGSGSVIVTVSPSSATWTALSNASWITITSAKSGTGSATLKYAVASNTGAARSGTLTIAGQTFTVNQAAFACSYQIGLGPITAVKLGFTGSVSVATSPGCQWTAASTISWLTITSGSTGSGNGTATYLAATNLSPSSRTGALIVAGYTINLTESGVSSRSAVQAGQPHR
jgi:hypothetical protein